MECTYCKEKIDNDYIIVISIETFEPVPIDTLCYDVFYGHANILTYFDGEKARTLLFDNTVAEDVDDWCTFTYPFDEIISGTRRLRIDAWRSSSQAPIIDDGWTTILDGWHSAIESSKMMQKIQNADELGLEYIQVITRTSNVCTIGFTFYVKSRDKTTWLKYFEEGISHEIYQNIEVIK